MSELSRSQRTAFVHIGTHKTGTTSIQEFLTRNERILRRHDVLVPKACRIDRHSGHHNLAWELSGDPRFDQRFGTLGTLIDEIRASHATHVCISTEDLELLHGDTNALERLRDRLCEAGYVPAIILYLRPQADYIESAYAEIVKARDLDFNEFLEAVLNDGHHGELLFNYDLLAGRFAHVFGHANMIVRRYESQRNSAFLLDAFLSIVAPDFAERARLFFPERLNGMARFPDVIASRERQKGRRIACAIPPTQRFDQLTSPDIARIAVAFESANERLAAAFGIAIPPATAAIVDRERFADLVNDEDARKRKRLIRAPFETVATELHARQLEAIDFTVQGTAGH